MISTSCLIGSLVPEPPWTARVAGVYTRAVSLLHDDGALISLLPNREDMEARAIWLDQDQACFSVFCTIPLAQPDRIKVDWREDSFSIRTENRLLAQFAVLDQPRYSGKDCLNTAGTLWQQASSAGRTASIDLIKTALRQAYRQGRQAQGIHGQNVYGKYFKKLRESPLWPANLVGFGPGTTPAGDDWLAGYLLAMALTASGRTAYCSGLRLEIQEKLTETNAAGRSLLLSALAEEPSARFGQLMLVCAQTAVAASRTAQLKVPEKAALIQLVHAVLAHGATSGEDMLSGFIAGLLLREGQ